MALGTIVSIKNCKPSGLGLKKLFLMICTAMKLVSINSIFAMAKLYASASAPASFDLCLSSCLFQLLCVDLKGIRSFRYKVVSIQVVSIQIEVVSIQIKSRFDTNQKSCFAFEKLLLVNMFPFKW